MKNSRGFLLVIVISVCIVQIIIAQSLPGTYTTTWSGNSLSGNPSWVQGYMLSGTVSPSGKVYTIAHWDEAGKTCGIYQNGNAVGQLGASGFAVTANSTNVFAQSGSSAKKFNFDGSVTSQTISMSFSPSFMAANKSYLVASDNGGNGVTLFSLSNGTVVKKWAVKNPGAVAIDSNNIVWVVSGVKLPEDRFERKWLVYDSTYAPRIYQYNQMGVKQLDSVFMYPEWRPACLSIDKNTNQLMVGDDGPKHQVNFFDISTIPALVKSFGTEGGISAGDPGIITPLKFWALKGVGTDASGNIYVIIGEDGSVIRSLKPTGELNWELTAANFVDVMNFDKYSDGRYLYGKNEIVEMDYNKLTPGKEWNMHAYTQDRTLHPSDPRNFYTALGHEYTSVWPRIIEGEMYLFTAGMYGIKPDVFKFTGKVASPAAYLKLNGNSAFYQDKEGSVWEVNGSGIVKTPLMAIEKNGDLIYGKVQTVSGYPNPFSSVSRILYDEERDIMFLTGDGNQIACYDNWSKGNRAYKFKGVLPSDYNQSVAVAGDFIFSCGVQTKSRIKVYSATDFKYIGMLEAGSVVGGPENTGWVDVPYGLNAIKRSNGEYIVAIEDDYKMKSVIFRWCPAGDCLQGAPNVAFNGLINKTALLPGDSVQIEVTAMDENGTIDSIQVYADTVLIATSHTSTLSYNWRNIPEGKYYLLAKTFDNDGLSATTYPVRIYVSDPDIIKPSAPTNLVSKDIATTFVALSWSKSTDNKGIAGYKILRDGIIEYVSGGRDTTYKAMGLLPETNYNFAVVSFDEALNLSDTSNIIEVTTKSDGPYQSSPLAIPGKIEFEYFDYGGEGIAYHDSDPVHIGENFRSEEGVDIGYSAAEGSNYLGWTETGEWLRYTVDIAIEGDYDVFFPTAGGGGSLTFTFSNGNKVYTATYSSTTDWDIWKTNVKTNIHLMPGVQYLTVKLNNQQVNLDYLKIIDHEAVNQKVPLNLELDTIIGNSATMLWELSGDVSNIKEYKVYRNGVFLETSKTKSYVAKNLVPGQLYTFSVSSVSLVGNESGKSNSIDVTVPLHTGINEKASGHEFSVYPNPASSNITIETGELFGKQYTLSITDLSGNVVLSKNVESVYGIYSQQMDNFPKGIYVVKIENEKASGTKTVILN